MHAQHCWPCTVRALTVDGSTASAGVLGSLAILFMPAACAMCVAPRIADFWLCSCRLLPPALAAWFIRFWGLDPDCGCFAQKVAQGKGACLSVVMSYAQFLLCTLRAR
jgi:hypothetical protein